MVRTRFGGGYYGATDSISCSTDFKTAPEKGSASGTAWQDHPVSGCRDKEVCLGTWQTLCRLYLFSPLRDDAGTAIRGAVHGK
jgi:hypothetical protein